MIDSRPVVYQKFIGFKVKPNERRILEKLAATANTSMSEVLRQAVAEKAQRAGLAPVSDESTNIA